MCSFASDCKEFLDRFSAEGFYLDDFSVERGKKADDLSKAESDAAVTRIAGLITEHRPNAVIGVLESIEHLVRAAVQKSDAPETPRSASPSRGGTTHNGRPSIKQA